MSRHPPWRAVADAFHLDALLGARQLRQRAGVLHLDVLGVRRRRAQHVRDVLGHLVAGHRQAGGVADRTLHEHRDVGGACAHVDQHHAELAFVRGQHRGARRQRRQDQVVDLQAAALHALADVGGRGLRAHHQVRMHFQAHAGHAHRVADAFLRVVQHVIARHRMQDLLVGRHCHRFRCVEHALEVGVGHFAVADRDDAGRVSAVDMVAGDRGIHAAHFAAGHQFGLLDRALDRLHGGIDVDHHALAQPARFMRADADHLDRFARRVFADQRGDLGGPDVEADDQRLVALAVHVFSGLSLRPAGASGAGGGRVASPSGAGSAAAFGRAAQLSEKPLV